MSMSEKDKIAVRNLALFCAAVFVVANPKGAAMVAGGAVVLAGATIWGIRSLQG